MKTALFPNRRHRHSRAARCCRGLLLALAMLPAVWGSGCRETAAPLPETAYAAATPAPSPAPTATATATVPPRIVLGQRSFPANADTVDFSGMGRVSDDALLAALANASPRQVNLLDTLCSDDAKRALLLAHPQTEFLWTVQVLPDVTADSRDTALDLSGIPVTDCDALAKQLELLPRLETLDMCSCGPGDEQMQRLREQFPSIKIAWLTTLGGWELRTDVTAFSMGNTKPWWNGLPGGKYVGEAPRRYLLFFQEDLARLRYFPYLEALDIGHAYQISDLSVLYQLPRLRYLIIAKTIAADLTPVGSLKELIYLELFSMQQVTDLSPLASCKKLQYLNCGNCQGVTDLTPLYSLTELKRLWIIGVPVSEAAVEQLRSALPETTVMEQGSHPTDSGWRTKNEAYQIMQKMFNLSLCT